MSGVTIEVDDPGVLAALAQLQAKMGNVDPVLRNIAEEVLFPSTERRFRSQVSPEGAKWDELSPEYQARKKRNADKILTLYGYLRETMAYQLAAGGLEFGSDRKYAARHQFGGTFPIAAHGKTVFWTAKGKRSSKAKASKSKSGRFSFSQVEVGAHEVKTPARPFLGLSREDKTSILEILNIYFLDEK
jgi:phage virion morphogenesis protein